LSFSQKAKIGRFGITIIMMMMIIILIILMLYYHDHYPLNLMVESSLAMISHKKKIDEWINMVMGLSNFTTINMDYTILPTIRMAGYGKKNNL
jgi:cell division protein FtsL